MEWNQCDVIAETFQEELMVDGENDWKKRTNEWMSERIGLNWGL